MRLAGCATLAVFPAAGAWYRAVRPQFAGAALQANHTRTFPSRFSSASIAHPQFEILYLAESAHVALFEVGALLGSLHGTHLLNPMASFSIIRVDVSLNHVADLTIARERRKIATSIQELTGDWRGYALRNPAQPQNAPFYSNVPTHKLGYLLNQVPDLEGVLTLSAKVPRERNLIVFPAKLSGASFLRFTDPATGRTITIP